MTESCQGRFAFSTSYEPYSDDPDYIVGNRGFIRDLDLQSAHRVLDLACGVGTLRDLLWEIRPQMTIVGIDISHEALRIARTRQEQGAGSTNGAPAEGCEGGPGPGKTGRRVGWLLAGSADTIPLVESSVDAVVMGHSIHLIEDADKLLSEIRRVLRPGGLFAFNTSFYAGTFAPGTEQLYHNWIKEALSYIGRKDRELRSQGLPGIRRIRGRVPPAFSKGWPSSQDWVQRLDRHGLKQQRQFERTVPLTQYSFEAIGAYAGFASVMLSGYPVEIACEALQSAAGPTMEAAGLDQVPRYWLEIAATRTQ